MEILEQSAKKSRQNLDDLRKTFPSSASISEAPAAQQGIPFLAANKSPIALPWPLEVPLHAPGTLFHSRLWDRPDPWSKRSPWDSESLRSAKLEYRLDDGGQATFQSIETSSTNDSEEHLSVSCNVTIGCSFLNASVTGAYDRDMMENKDDRKQSIKASYRAGSIMLLSRPSLSLDALVILKHQGGIPAFKYDYGDYYIAGYRLGGDAAVALSESYSAVSKVESLSIKVSIQVLFFSASITHEKFFRSSSADSSFRVSGFDTLTKSIVPAGRGISIYSADSKGGSALEQLAVEARKMEKLCIELPLRVSQEINKFGLKRGQEITWERLQELLEGTAAKNLVVEAILLPVTTIRPVLEWSMSADVIGF